MKTTIIRRRVQAKMADLLKLKEGLESGEHEAVLESLEALNTMLIADISVSLAADILSNIPLPILFSCLQTEHPEQINLSCAVLEKLLVHLTASQLLLHGRYVELGLQYPEPKVAKTCLQLLLRLCVDDGVGELIRAPTMLHLITQLLGGEDLQCASLAGNILLHFSRQCHILDKLKSVWFSELNSLLRSSDTVRYRVYDLVVKTCLQGGVECFTIMVGAGYLDQLVKELQVNDPLVKMNCIELLSCLVDTPKGLNFLQTSQVLDKLYATLTSSEHDVMSAILIPGKGQCFIRVYILIAVYFHQQFSSFLVVYVSAWALRQCYCSSSIHISCTSHWKQLCLQVMIQCGVWQWTLLGC